MKIHKPEPVDLIRVSIRKQGENTEYVSLSETTQAEAIAFFQELLKPHVSLFPDTARTTIDVREAKGGKNGKSKSFHFYGLSPKQTYDIILKNIK